jgi:hypothetical protein
LPSPPNKSSWRPRPPPAQSASAQKGVELHAGLDPRLAAQRSALRMTHFVPFRPRSQQVAFGRRNEQVDARNTRASAARQDAAMVPAFTAAPMAVRVQSMYCERLEKPSQAHVATTAERTSPAAARSQGAFAASAMVGASRRIGRTTKPSSERDMHDGYQIRVERVHWGFLPDGVRLTIVGEDVRPEGRLFGGGSTRASSKPRSLAPSHEAIALAKWSGEPVPG